MNKSPESRSNETSDTAERTSQEDAEFDRDLAREERVLGGAGLADDAALGADRDLRRTLAQLEAPQLPPHIRETVLDTGRGSRLPMAWAAIAAAVVLSVITLSVADPFESPGRPGDLSAQDWAQLSLAIETLNAQGQQIAQVTQREVGAHLSLPDIELPQMPLRIDALPGSNSFWRWFQPSAPQTR